jgi:hypothetical protein
MTAHTHEDANGRRLSAGWPLAAAVGLVALAARAYGIAATPVWFDEIYSYLLVRGGPGPILANSLADPHPPGWYLSFWLTSGFGQFASEWALRWPSVLLGALTPVLIFFLARRHAAAPAACAAALLAALSPMHLSFSQEARPTAMIVLVAALATLLLQRALEAPERRGRWALLTLLASAGMYLNYFFALLVGAQLLSILAFRHWRAAAGYLLGVLLLTAPALYLFLRVVPAVAGHYASSVPSLPLFVAGLLAGEPVRFGIGWWHWGIPALLLPLALLGGLAARRDRMLLPYLIQAAAPFAAFWLLGVALLQIGLPPSEIKHFLVVLPACFVLVAAGLDRLAARLGWRAGGALAGGLTVAVLALSMASIANIWSVSKSPEGDLARSLGAQVGPGSTVVTLSHSPAAALRFYRPDLDHYGALRSPSTEVSFVRMPDEGMILPPDAAAVALSELLARPELWVVFDTRRPDATVQLFAGACTPVSERAYGPFVLAHYTSCAP